MVYGKTKLTIRQQANGEGEAIQGNKQNNTKKQPHNKILATKRGYNPKNKKLRMLAKFGIQKNLKISFICASN